MMRLPTPLTSESNQPNRPRFMAASAMLTSQATPTDTSQLQTSCAAQNNAVERPELAKIACYHCYCGAKAHTGCLGNVFCSQGCDWSGIAPAYDDCDSALDSGCECAHHKVLQEGKPNVRPPHPWEPTSVSIDMNSKQPNACFVLRTEKRHNMAIAARASYQIGRAASELLAELQTAHLAQAQVEQRVAWGGDSDEDDGLLLTDIAMSIEQPSPHTPSARLPHGAHQHTQLVKLTDGLSKRDVAMLKLLTCKRTREHEVLWAIEDLIGPCSSWPDRERQIYWMKKLNHRDALRVVTFGLGNGLPPHLIFEWLRVREVKVHWPDFHNDMQLIQKIMELEEPIDKFYYDLRAKEWCFMNGLPRNAITKKVKGRKTEQGTKASLPSP